MPTCLLGENINKKPREIHKNFSYLCVMDKTKKADYHKEEIKTKLEYLKIDVFFLFSLATGSISLLLNEYFEASILRQLLFYFGFIGSLACFIYLVVLTKNIRGNLNELKQLQYDTNNNG